MITGQGDLIMSISAPPFGEAGRPPLGIRRRSLVGPRIPGGQSCHV